MKKILACALSLIALVSCGSPPPNEELIQKYTSATKSYAKLAEMIEADTRTNDFFVVGKDNIGGYWYSEVSGSWSNASGSAETNLSLEKVLSKVGLTKLRYEEYMRLFEQTGSERVTFDRDKNTSSSVVKILVFRSGTTMGGWNATICKRKGGIMPQNTSTNCCTTINTPIREGWYLSVRSVS